jgi:hypothetical protein
MLRRYQARSKTVHSSMAMAARSLRWMSSTSARTGS